MKSKLFVFTFLCFLTTSYLIAQAPFTTLVKRPSLVEKKGDTYVMYDIEKRIKAERQDFSVSNKDDTFNTERTYENIVQENKKEETKNSIGFFKNNSLALTILDKADNRASISSQVLFYNIGIMTPVKSQPKNWSYQIPMMVISKLSTSYDSISGSSALDVLDYEAAPVTLRIMPSWNLSGNKKYKEQFLLGFYADARGINVQNTDTNDYDLEVVGSGGFGFTLTGHGEAGFYNEEGNYAEGEWLVSAMLQGAIGEKEVIQRLFNTEKDYVTSFQTYFVFKVSEDSKFNLKIGYQYFFQETIAGTKNNFSIALGI